MTSEGNARECMCYHLSKSNCFPKQTRQVIKVSRHNFWRKLSRRHCTEMLGYSQLTPCDRQIRVYSVRILVSYNVCFCFPPYRQKSSPISTNQMSKVILCNVTSGHVLTNNVVKNTSGRAPLKIGQLHSLRDRVSVIVSEHFPNSSFHVYSCCSSFSTRLCSLSIRVLL